MRSPVEFGRSLFPRSPSRQFQLEQEILEEIEFHLDCRAQANRECGMGDEESRSAALDQFGDPESILDRCVVAHDGHPGRRFGRFSARILPLGLASGLAAAVLIIMYALVVRMPATYPQGGQWIAVWWEHASSGIRTSDSSIEDYESWRDRSETAEYVGLATYRPVVGTIDEVTERFMGKYVVGDYLVQHQMKPVIGRTFSGDASSEALRPIVISHDLWERRFDCAPNALGSKMDIEGVLHTIVGVAPRGYQTYYPFDYFAPLAIEGQDRSRRRYLVSARLKPGATLERVQEEFAALDPTADQNTGWDVLIRNPQDVYGGNYPRRLIPFGVLALMLLAVVIVKGHVQGRQNAGFGLTAIVLGVAAVGMMTAVSAIALFRNTILTGVDQRFNFGVDLPMLAGFVAIITLAVLATERPRLSPRRFSSRNDHDSPRRVSFSLVLTNALAFLMLVSAVTLTNDWWQRRTPDLGFDIGGVFTLPLLLSDSQFPDRESRHAFFEEAISAIDSIGSIEQYSFSLGFPTVSESQGVTIKFSDPFDSTREQWFRIPARAVGLDFFETIGVRTLAGKPFERSPHEGRLGAAVVNAAMAAKYWPDGSAIGRRISIDGVAAPFEITAVVENSVSSTPGDEKDPVLYPLVWHWTMPRMIVVRTQADFQTVANRIQKALSTVDAAATVGNMAPGDAAIRAADRKRAMTVAFLWASALLALALSSSFTFRSVRRVVDKGVRLLTLRRSSKPLGHFAFRPQLLGVTASLVVGGLFSSPLSYLLVTELSLEAQVGALCVVLPAIMLLAIHLAVAYIPLRRFLRVLRAVSPTTP